MVNPLRRPVSNAESCGASVAGRIMMVAILGWALRPADAQEPPVHFMVPQGLPPGAIGSQQLQRGGPLAGYFQPVEIRAPAGVLISLAEEGRFSTPAPAPLRLGLLVGQVYRFGLINVPLREGAELFPTIEVINRLYTPRGQETRFPVVIELTREDLSLALDGKLVTRVIYLEDPKRAVPVRQIDKGQGGFDVGPGQDPLTVADVLGRPMAIVRVGGRVPDQAQAPDPAFLFGCPPLLKFSPKAAAAPGPATARRAGAEAAASAPQARTAAAPAAAAAGRTRR